MTEKCWQSRTLLNLLHTHSTALIHSYPYPKLWSPPTDHILFLSTTPSPPLRHPPPPPLLFPIVPPIPNLLLPQLNNFDPRSAQLLLLFSPFFPCLAVPFLPLSACKLPSMVGPCIPTSVFTLKCTILHLLLSLLFSIFKNYYIIIPLP